MKASKVLETRIKELITDNDGEYLLKNAVTIKSRQYTGFNYDTNKHEYVLLDWSIKQVLRCGKRGVAYVSDGINQWRPSELSESECEAIMREIS